MATQLEPDIHADEDAFRTEVQQFLAANFPDELKNKGNALAGVDGPTDETPAQKAWREAVGERGWGTPTWPKQYGGGGLTKAQAKIIDQEFAKAGAYNPIGGMGVMMFGPTLLEYGSEEQKMEHIPPICRGEIRWCQGYSEPMPAPTSPTCRPSPKTRAIITSSMARRPGPAAASGPTSVSPSCGPTRATSTAASASC